MQENGPPGLLLATVRLITDEKQQEAALRKQLALQGSLAHCAQTLLRDQITSETVPEALDHIRRGIGADRAYIFENYSAGAGRLMVRMAHEHCAPDIAPSLPNLTWQTLDYTSFDPALFECLSVGKVYHRHTGQMPIPAVRHALETEEVQSVVIVPLYRLEQWYGFLGFDYCRTLHTPDAAQWSLLSTATEVFSAYLGRVHNRRSLQLSQERTQALLQNIPDLLFVHSLEGVYLECYTPTEVQPLLPLAQFIGKHVREVLPEPMATQVLAVFQQVAQGKTRQQIEYPLELPDGLHYFEAHVVPFGENQILSVVRDITERHRAAAQRVQLLAEQERVKVLQQFISDASHDLMTPLSILRTSTYLIERAPQIDHRERLRNIHAQVDRLESLISDMLMMAHLDEPAALVYRFVPTDLCQMVVQLYQDFMPLARAKDQTLRVQVPSVPQVVPVDGDKLRRALSNLLNNALKYTPEGARVEVSAQERARCPMVRPYSMISRPEASSRTPPIEQRWPVGSPRAR
ncbi:MAG: PAS domain-containing protein [Anaerolineae bacterium]|nr:PAS domain-containing protein [Anaerolineae bacterium]